MKAGMRVVFSAMMIASVVSAGLPGTAAADDGGWGWHRGWGWREHEWRERHPYVYAGPGVVYAPPPPAVIYAPPPPAAVYAPPAVVYAPPPPPVAYAPPVAPAFNLVVPLNFR
ncbi:MAG: hypothetical protein M0006_01565 [Magnetospirillum sp.]|nr:hypothetical protein [Magnetospirillum sp.]